MNIFSSEFIKSNTDVRSCPETALPEYAFIGRSNVGKSSLINMLTQKNGLALTSGKPGKTLLINHFLINKEWFLVDLPGYGFAQTGLAARERLRKMIDSYILLRKPLINLFVLIDSRLEPQSIDLQFIEWLGVQEIPFSIVFTKTDKLSVTQFLNNRKKYEETLFQTWETLPLIFETSSKTGKGRVEILNYIEELNDQYGKN
ncbi:ribosome biogenesis GTP-binding protein YihA/YsxC [Microbacter margulisiae]|uniref:Probable GTP-binding protein EngB n=1 Tax=Microbacter margulisiae TaxID=1350067 RepID=A0A7W5H0D4_9PORP|nr:ribosome biogenesis GTP-binding protein YihA/YsxC [Microbacter margulisiae]MBB3186438.1 GTP-binding protein [Microbacter margulisiae]